MSPEQERVAGVVADVWAEATDLVCSDPSRCVLSTRVGVDVLRYFGVPAEPELVQTFAFSPAYVEWVNAGGDPNGTPHDEWPPGAWSVGIDLRPERPGGFPGHVVVRLADDALLDLDARQFARPAYGLVVPTTLALRVDPDLWRAGELATFGLDGGSAISYRRLDDPRLRATLAAAPNWRYRAGRESLRPIIGQTIRVARARLSAAAADYPTG